MGRRNYALRPQPRGVSQPPGGGLGGGAAGGVTTFNGRSGAVTPQAGDYPPSLIGAVPTSRTVTTAAPLTGGGPLTGDLTLGVSAATATVPGVVQVGALATGEYWALGSVTGAATGTLAGVANQIALHKWTQVLGNAFNLTGAEVTGAIAGAQFQIVYYKIVNGAPAGLIWRSGNLSGATVAVQSLAFSAGTWVDTAYRSGSNLFVPPGETIAVGVLHSANATLRAIAVGGVQPYKHAGTAGANGIQTQGTANTGAFSVPNVAPALTGRNSAVPLIFVRAA